MQHILLLPTIIRLVAESPSALDDVPPRQFEELVAELLAGQGWDVSLTPQSRDVGYDILGISRDAAGFESSWAVECKHYRPGRKVGVDTLRSLYGIKEGLGLSNGVLVTSSDVTSEARMFAQAHRALHIVDRLGLLQWFARYKPRRSAAPYVAKQTFHSCFVSYSHKDEAFAQSLVSRLKTAGIKVWFAPESLLPGRKIHEEVFKAISSFDKLLLILSKDSMSSTWVASEIRRARKREVKESCRVLFPISLVPIDEIEEWTLFDADNGQDLAAEIREYLIPNFSDWRKPHVFEKQFNNLLSGLQAAASQETHPK